MKFKITTPIIEPTEGSPHALNTHLTQLYSSIQNTLFARLYRYTSPLRFLFIQARYCY
ncbi:hypothetical protein L4D20_11105 [Vibrio kyushuensis]|uniref:hypothetical protein n=1 Tax=Vibrio kyushuensis TaxID=2910249 RepID=UPI003D0EBD60